MHDNRTLIRGDNLTEMRKLPDACVDFIATDPPFYVIIGRYFVRRVEAIAKPNFLPFILYP